MPNVIGIAGSKKVVQLIMKNTLAGGPRPVSAVFYFFRTSPGTADNKAAIGAAFLAGTYAALLAAWNVNVADGAAFIRYMDDALDAFLLVPLAGVGAIATDRLPSTNSVYMQLNTGIRGKTYRGSKKFYGLNEIDTAADLLTGAGLVRWQAVQTALVVPLTAGGETYVPAVVSFKAPTQIKTNPTNINVNQIANVVLNLDTGTMKRRKVARSV